MTTNRHIKLGRTTALISFLAGTIIFGLYYLTSAFELLFVGYGFIALIGLINIGVLIAILIKARKDNENRSRLLKTCGLMILNIPVMIAYCWVAIILLGTMRITFTNGTETELTDINIIGCGGGHIDKLKVGESETVWVSITGDCSIFIDYVSDGQTKKETVAGYVTSSMGQKLNHKIDGEDKDIF
jgi:heme/copper-type cytochrome/quinol oxidase subunit 2